LIVLKGIQPCHQPERPRSSSSTTLFG